MAVVFPPSPTVGQIVSDPNTGASWQWNGVAWVPLGGAGGALSYATVGQSSYNVGRNYIHNPMFMINQRGGGPYTANGLYTCDRWLLNFAGDTGVAVNLPGLSDAIRAQIGDENAWVCLQTSFVGTAGAGFTLVAQPIESVLRISGKTITVSFWAACVAGSLGLGVSLDQHFGNGGSPSAPVIGNGQAVVLSSTTWNRYSMTFQVPSAAGKTFGNSAPGADLTYINFWFSSGATQASRAGNIGVQSGTVNIWGVQVELGSVATPLEHRDPAVDLELCKRFYQLIQISGTGYGATGMGVWISSNFATPMRAAPTVTLTNNSSNNVSGLAVAAQSPAGIGTGVVATGNITSGPSTASISTFCQCSADLV